jgi:hypothetical protein
MKRDKVLAAVLRQLARDTRGAVRIARQLGALLGDEPQIPELAPCAFKVAGVSYRAILTEPQGESLKTVAKKSPADPARVRQEALRLLGCIDGALGPALPALVLGLGGVKPRRSAPPPPNGPVPVPLGACHFPDPPYCQDNISKFACDGIPGSTQWDQGGSCASIKAKKKKR